MLRSGMEGAIPHGLHAEVQASEEGDRYQMLEVKLRELNGSIECVPTPSSSAFLSVKHVAFQPMRAAG